MGKKTLIIVFVIVSLLVGLFLGYVFGYNQNLPLASSNPFDLLNSKLVENVNVSFLGQVASISEKTIRIEGKGTSLDLEIPENISVMKQPEFSGEKVPPAPAQMKLTDLKQGDSVQASVLLDSGGKVNALVIVVLPTEKK